MFLLIYQPDLVNLLFFKPCRCCMHVWNQAEKKICSSRRFSPRKPGEGPSQPVVVETYKNSVRVVAVDEAHVICRW